MRLEDLTVTELKARAKKRGLRGYSRLRKKDLVEALRGKKTTTRKSRRRTPRKSSRRRTPKKSSRRRRRTSRRRSPKKSSRRRRRTSRRRTPKKSSRRRRRTSRRRTPRFKTEASWMKYAESQGYLLKMSDLKPGRCYKIVHSIEQGNTRPEIICIARNNGKEAWTKENVEYDDDGLFYNRRGFAVTGSGSDHAMFWTKFQKMPDLPSE